MLDFPSDILVIRAKLPIVGNLSTVTGFNEADLTLEEVG